MSNKCGVAVSFKFGDTKLLFIAAHLTSHHNKVEQRNADYHRINSLLTLTTPSFSPSSTLQQQQQQPPPQPPQPQKNSVLEQFDYVFWFGDLNYRINGNRKIVEETVKQSLTEVEEVLFNCG